MVTLLYSGLLSILDGSRRKVWRKRVEILLMSWQLLEQQKQQQLTHDIEELCSPFMTCMDEEGHKHYKDAILEPLILSFFSEIALDRASHMFARWDWELNNSRG